MAFFSISQSDELHNAVAARNAELTQEQLQPYADALYDIIVQDVTDRREEIFNELLAKIKTSSSTRSIYVPIWSYNVRYYAETKEDYKKRYIGMSIHERVVENINRNERDATCSRNGWHWTLGMWSGDYYTDQPIAVNVLVKRTDLCARLSAFFSNNLDMIVRPFAREVVYGNDLYSVVRQELQLEYYPMGLNVWTKPKIEAAMAKYKDYVPKPTSGSPKLDGPGRFPPLNPEDSPPPSPVARSRCTSYGCNTDYSDW